MKIIKVIDYTKLITVKKTDKESKKDTEKQVPYTYYLLSYTLNLGDYEKTISMLIKPVFIKDYDNLEKVSLKRVISFNKDTGKREVHDFYKVDK